MDVDELSILRLVGLENDPLDFGSANVDLQLTKVTTAQFSLQML